MGFMHPKTKIKGKIKLKTKLTKTKIQKQFYTTSPELFLASKRNFKFTNSSIGSGDISAGARDLHFALEFLYHFDFQVRKTHLKRFDFEILFIGDQSSTLYLSNTKVVFSF